MATTWDNGTEEIVLTFTLLQSQIFRYYAIYLSRKYATAELTRNVV